MKLKLFYIIFLFSLLNSCKSQNIEAEQDFKLNEYILLNENFIDIVKDRVIQSQTKAVLEEKSHFIRRNIKDSNYLETLDRVIENPYASYNATFFNDYLKSLVYDRFKNTKVNGLYFLNIQLHGGGMILKYDFVIIEGLDQQIDLFYFNNKNFEIKHKKITNYFFIDFIHELMLNTPYSFENKSLFNNNVQYFTMDKITAIGKNKFIVESVVVSRMLNYQIEIFKTFLDFEI